MTYEQRLEAASNFYFENPIHLEKVARDFNVDFEDLSHRVGAVLRGEK